MNKTNLSGDEKPTASDDRTDSDDKSHGNDSSPSHPSHTLQATNLSGMTPILCCRDYPNCEHSDDSKQFLYEIVDKTLLLVRKHFRWDDGYADILRACEEAYKKGRDDARWINEEIISDLRRTLEGAGDENTQHQLTIAKLLPQLEEAKELAKQRGLALEGTREQLEQTEAGIQSDKERLDWVMSTGVAIDFCTISDDTGMLWEVTLDSGKSFENCDLRTAIDEARKLHGINASKPTLSGGASLSPSDGKPDSNMSLGVTSPSQPSLRRQLEEAKKIEETLHESCANYDHRLIIAEEKLQQAEADTERHWLDEDEARK